jgi:hypothetical protein
LPHKISFTVPITSGDSKFLTSILSTEYIFIALKANEIHMTRPSPSCTKTTKTTTIELNVSESYPRMYKNTILIDAMFTTIFTINKIKINTYPKNAPLVI